MQRTFPRFFLETTRKTILQEKPVRTPREKEIRRICAKLFKCQERKDGDRVLNILDDMRIQNIQPHFAIYRHALNALVRSKKITEANDLVKKIKNEGYTLNPSTLGFLINAQKFSGDVESAESYFSELKENTPLTAISSLLNVYTSKRDVKSAEKIFSDLKAKNIAPNAHIYGNMLKLYAKSSKSADAYKIIEEMKQNRLEINTIHWNLYLQSVSVKDTMIKRFEEMKDLNIERDIMSYQIAIRLFCKRSHYEQVFEYYERCKKVGLVPNRDIVRYVLLAAKEVQNVSILRSVIKEMGSFGVQPDDELVGILVQTRKDIALKKRINKETIKRKHLKAKKIMVAQAQTVAAAKRVEKKLAKAASKFTKEKAGKKMTKKMLNMDDASREENEGGH